MKAGTIVRVADGREGTVVYNFLDGYGLAWGRYELSESEVGWPPVEVMLRKPYEGCDPDLEYVGGDCEELVATNWRPVNLEPVQ